MDIENGGADVQKQQLEGGSDYEEKPLLSSGEETTSMKHKVPLY